MEKVMFTCWWSLRLYPMSQFKTNLAFFLFSISWYTSLLQYKEVFLPHLYQSVKSDCTDIGYMSRAHTVILCLIFANKVLFSYESRHFCPATTIKKAYTTQRKILSPTKKIVCFFNKISCLHGVYQITLPDRNTYPLLYCC